MRSFIAILLASAFLFQSTSKLFIVAHYALNKDFIAKNLCENKAKPQMHCNGKCHLKKQLQKEDKKEGSVPVSSKEKYEIQLFSERQSPLNNTTFDSKHDVSFCYFINVYNKHLSAVFHPPQA